MAFDAFIKIDGIDGESTDEKHSDWIEVIKFGPGVKQKISITPAVPAAQAQGAPIFVNWSSKNYSTSHPPNSPRLAPTAPTSMSFY